MLTVSGRISHRTSAEWEAALASAMDAGGPGVVVDLSNVDYISSPGLRALESAATRLAGEGRRFVVCGVHDAVTVAFTLAGLIGALAIEPSRDAAVALAATPIATGAA